MKFPIEQKNASSAAKAKKASSVTIRSTCCRDRTFFRDLFPILLESITAMTSLARSARRRITPISRKRKSVKPS